MASNCAGVGPSGAPVAPGWPRPWRRRKSRRSPVLSPAEVPSSWRGVTDLPKGECERTVDLPASAVDALKAHRHLRGRFVFCQEDGQPLTEGKMKQPLRRALNRAGISREEGRSG